MRALFKSVNLIGDALYVGPALRAWIKQQKGPVEIWLETLNDHVAPLYYGMVRDFLHGERYHEEARHLKTFAVIHNHPEGQFDFEHTFDVSAAFKLSDQKKQHLATSYAELLGVKIGDTKESLKPIYIPDTGEIPPPTIPEGCILVSMFSASCSGRDPKCNYVPNKMLPWLKWEPMLNYLRLQFPDTPIKFLGAPADMVPNGYAMNIVRPGEYMLGIPLNRLALIMKTAKLLVTIDNGMSHLGASQETPTFLMYPVALGPHYILPIGNPNLVWLHMNPVTVDKERLLAGLVWAVTKFQKTVWKEKK
jgi:hypothetical protein